jgi:hypothetical protein
MSSRIASVSIFIALLALSLALSGCIIICG